MRRYGLYLVSASMILALLVPFSTSVAQASLKPSTETLLGSTSTGVGPARSATAVLEWEVAGEQFHLYIRKASGKRDLVLSENANVMHSVLARLSPDGQQVAFVTAGDFGFRDAAVWLIGSDGTGRRELVDSGKGYWVTNPLWSPDGRRLAYVRVTENQAGELLGTQLRLYDLAQDVDRQLVTSPAFAPIMVVGVAQTLEWTAENGLYFVDIRGQTARTYEIDPASGALRESERSPLGTTVSPQACQNMVKPVPIRDYDGSVGNGYYVAYLDKYTYTTWEGSGSHPGVDISGGGVSAGATIVAVADGHVEQAGWVGLWGNLAVLRHDGDGCDGTVFSIYAHMQSAPVVTGDISRGTTLGRVGSTGNSSGPHLHFQIDRNNTSHPYWPTRSGQCDLCSWDNPNHVVNNPDTDNIVKSHTHSPMRFVQDRAGNSQPGCADGEGAVLYEHSNYGGRCTRFTSDDNRLSDNPIGNDAASSIKVIGNFEAVVYENDDWGGTSTTFTGDDPDFGNDSINHDRASSIRVRRRDSGGVSNCDGGQGVYLYEHPNYAGRCSKFTGDAPNPREWYVGNDTASSMHIIGNYEATVCEHDDYNGVCSTFTTDDSDFGNDSIGHDRASSIRVRYYSGGGSSNCDGGQGVYLYEHSNYTGRCSKFTSDSPNPREWYIGNDAASSVHFVGGYQATVYEHDDYNGASSTFSGDDPDFGNDSIGHDRASSIRVRQYTPGPTSCADGQFLAEYFANRDLSGGPTFRRCVSSIGEDWGYGGPGSGVGSDNFSIRWSGRFWFDEATYRFTTRTDDGVKFWLNGILRIDQWRDMGATEFTVERNLGAGMHTLRMEYYENGGYATARLSWQRLPPQADTDDGRTIGYGDGLDGTVSPALDRDDYYFSGSAGQDITIRMDRRDSNLDSYIELYNPDGSLLGQDDDSGGNLNSQLAITLRQNGLHKIIAHGYGNSVGGYRISLSRESTRDSDDYRWIPIGGTLQGTISPSNDRDWYYFSGVSGRIVSIRMNKIDSGLDSYLELYNPAGVKVTENDDGGGDRNSWVVYTLPTNGVYRIMARSWNLSSSGRYNLSLSLISNVNLARGRPAWATSTEFSGVEPYKAFDGSISTRWSSRFYDPQLIYVDLGTLRTFNQVILRWETAYARQYGIYYWNGSAWRNVYWTNYGNGGNDTITFSPVQARYVGMYGVQRGTSWGYSLWEFEVYDNTSVPLPEVPPDPGDKPPEENVDPLTPLPPNDPGKETLLIGEGSTGQEDMPLAETTSESPTGGVGSSVPTAHILYPNDPMGGLQDVILFQGVAFDNDEDGASIVGYRWLSSLDGQIGSSDTFTLTRDSLSRGAHVITLQALDNEGDWSEPVTTTLTTVFRVYVPLALREGQH